MSIQSYQNDHLRYLAIAGELVDGPVRAIDLDWFLEQELTRRLRLEERRGLDDLPPLVQFNSDRSGHELVAGIERYRLDAGGQSLRLVRVVAPAHASAPEVYYRFWAVHVDHYRPLYRFLRHTSRKQQEHVPPILRDADRQRLWNNTVAFLRQGCQRWKQFGIPPKRGVLLLGDPGNGKTMACRWLRSECNQYGLEWHNVSSEEYDQARHNGTAHELFELSRPGIVFFDDVDMAMRNRGREATTSDHSTFLGGLDGIDTHLGVVYLFTSNARLDELDPAFRRPGRIDLVMHFPRPDAALRRRLVETCWHAEVRARLDIREVVAATDGFSFAELEELKKLLVMHYFETDQIDLCGALRAFHAGRGDDPARNRIGFVTPPAPLPATPSLGFVTTAQNDLRSPGREQP